jgi:hypothetical protein
MEKENIMDMDIFVQEEARKRIEQDINERIAVHKANIVRLATAQASATTLGVAVRNRPLILLAQGDSWFDYPLTGNGLPLVDTDVIAQLRRIGPMPPIILNLAHHGDAAVDEMSLPKQERMIAALRDPSNWTVCKLMNRRPAGFPLLAAATPRLRDAARRRYRRTSD